MRPLTGLRVGPFYGCYVLRPTSRLGYAEHPERDHYLEQVIEALGGEPVDYEGARKCCGFPVITMNRETSLKQAGRHIGDAIDADADALVTPCPLCHLNLDLQQPDAAKVVGRDLGLPVLHLPAARRPRARLRAQGARHEQARRAHGDGRAQARLGGRKGPRRSQPPRPEPGVRPRLAILAGAANDVRDSVRRARSRKRAERAQLRSARAPRRSSAGSTRPARACGARSAARRRGLTGFQARRRVLSAARARDVARAVAGLVVVADPLGDERGRPGDAPGGPERAVGSDARDPVVPARLAAQAARDQHPAARRRAAHPAGHPNRARPREPPAAGRELHGRRSPLVSTRGGEEE